MPPRNRQQRENLVRQALHSVAEHDSSFVETWWDEFPRTPRPKAGGRDQRLFLAYVDNTVHVSPWTDYDGSYDSCLETYENEWILEEWVFAIACHMLDDGNGPSQVRVYDVVSKIRFNRERVSFKMWRQVNENWLRGRGRLRNRVEGF